MTDAPIVINEYDAICIRLRRPHSQEIRIRLSDLPALVGEIVKLVPRGEHGAALIDQIIAAIRAQRPRDRTNAERQRRFRQRRRAQQPRAGSIGKEGTPA